MGRTALLQIEVHTPHGAAVSGADVRVTGGAEERSAVEVAAGAYRVEIPEPGDYALRVARAEGPGGFEHRPLEATLRVTPEEGRARVEIALAAADGGAPAGAAGIGEVREEDGIHTLPVTLDYVWFTPIGYPPTLGNRVDLLVDGEESWAAVAEALEGARRTIHLTTWIYQPSAELRRPHPLAEPHERSPLTAQRMLEERARAGAVVRLLLWDAPLLSPPGELRRAKNEEGARFQVLEEANPTRRPLLDEQWRITNGILGRFPIGSYHQKTAVFDGRIGFCGGMNIKENDWDTRRHQLFDPRRCAFSRPASFRKAVTGREQRPDHLPRHDFMARVEGPAVAHLEENFLERWNRLLDREAGSNVAARATPVEPPAPPPPVAGGSQVQVVRTMPARLPASGEVPALPAERGILDVYLRAIAAARRLIYIEDQYFRSTYVSDAIAAQIRAFPELAVVVLTSERQANDIVARGWARECFERVRRALPGFELHALRVGGEDCDGRWALVEVDNHAKLLIVDDRFLLVGSCNVNDRGFDFEGEIDVAVADPALARRVRVDLWREHLDDDARLCGDITVDLAVWRERAERNRAYHPEQASGPPAGHVFPFVPRGRRWMLVGPAVV